MNKDKNKTREPMFDGVFIFGFLFCWVSVFALNYIIIKIDWPPLNHVIDTVAPTRGQPQQPPQTHHASVEDSTLNPAEPSQKIDDLPHPKRIEP